MDEEVVNDDWPGSPRPLRERLLALARYEPIFADPDFSFGQMIARSPDENGVFQMPWFSASLSNAIAHLLAARTPW